MFYFVTSILIGFILVVSSLYLLLKNKKDILSNLLYLFSGIGLIACGIIGFLIVEKYHYIIILLMLLFSCICIVNYYIINKKPSKK